MDYRTSWRRVRNFFGALLCTFASLRSLTPSAKTVHRTVFFRRLRLLPPCSNPLFVLQSKKQALRPAFRYGGELGIRTLGTLRTQHFECCTFDHSDNSPCFSLLRHARLHIATCIIPNISILVNKNKHQIINFLYVLK